MIGQTLSHYKIIEKLGSGGQGEVYLAEDSRLDRKVALKILPQHLSERAELRERFEREARAVSSLNHPHICTLHDIGEQDGIHYLVMEHLVGETLEARLAKGPLPLEQTLQYAIQIADALDKAHRQGVVHRDLKPGNIMLVKSGAKLLDFGLAKLQAAETPTNLSALPTEQASLTAEGTILGTLQYMAPEQLEGKEADSRTDIFAFGAVVYEMATGKKAFEGKSQASLIAAIMGQDPRPMSELQPMTPQLLNRVVRKCLAKEPDERWQSASDLMTGLRWVTEVGTPAESLPAVATPGAWRRAIPWSLAGLIAIIAVVGLWILTRPTPQLLRKFAITPPAAAPLAITLDNGLAISPDGKRIVYLVPTARGRSLYVRSLDELIATPIAGTEGARGNHFFSPDGESVAFFTNDRKLKKVSLLGGTPITLLDGQTGRGAGSWAEDTIVFSTGVSLYRVSAAGGEPDSLAIPDAEKGESGFTSPRILPGGKAVLFSIWLGDASYQTAVLSLETGERKVLLEGGRDAHYAPTGHLVYELFGTGTLMAVPFDLGSLEIVGDSVPILQGVRQAPTGWVNYSFSGEGTLVYVPAGPSGERRLAWVDRQGKAEFLAAPPRLYDDPRLSPDGLEVVLQVEAPSDIWIYDIARDTLRRLTFEGSGDTPLWTPDGKRVTFGASEGGLRNLFWKASDGSGPEERLRESEFVELPVSWSPDGRVLAFHSEHPTSGFDIWILPMEGEREAQPFLQTRFQERQAVFSPDGDWLAYVSDESGQDEIYVQPFPGPGGNWLISSGGGTEPVWSASGELFFRSGAKMMAVEITTHPTFSPGKPSLLFEDQYVSSGTVRADYDVTPDGQRFLMIKYEGTGSEINIVLNWFEELKRLVPTNN